MGEVRRLGRRKRRFERTGDDFGDDVERYLNRPGWRLFGVTVLVVENDALNMKVLRDLLGLLGHSVVEAHGEAEGLALAAAHPPDLVLVAVYPGDGSAAGFRGEVKSIPGLADVPVVALIDPIGTDDGTEIADGNFEGAVSKPISLRLFLRVIEELLPEKPVQGTLPARL